MEARTRMSEMWPRGNGDAHKAASISFSKSNERHRDKMYDAQSSVHRYLISQKNYISFEKTSHTVSLSGCVHENMPTQQDRWNVSWLRHELQQLQ